MKLLPTHWVGIKEKRHIPAINLKIECDHSCHYCKEKAIDTAYNFWLGIDSEVVYCSKHGWAFPTKESEKEYVCNDYEVKTNSL